MTQVVVGEDVMPLLYQVSAGLHCVGLNFPVSSTDQHLEGGHGKGRDSMQGLGSGRPARLCKDAA